MITARTLSCQIINFITINQWLNNQKSRSKSEANFLESQVPLVLQRIKIKQDV